MGLCCVCPFPVGAVIGLVSAWRRGAKTVAFWGTGALVLFLGFAGCGIARYIVLEEGVVMDACDGDATGIAWRLEKGGNANARAEGLGALECATTNGHVEAARILLEHGADPDAAPDYTADPFRSRTPRQWASASKDRAMIRLFEGYPGYRKAR